MLIPKILTIVFVLAGLALALLLARAAMASRTPRALLRGALQRLDATNRWILIARLTFFILLGAVIGFHSYWAFFADRDQKFNRAKHLDARNRRLAESALKGWVLDRSRKLENALIRYRYDGGLISRDYPLGPAAVHLTGYSDFVFGSGGIESAFRDWLTSPDSTYNELLSPVPVGKDIAVSIDSVLQREVFGLIQATGKPAGAVVLLLPSNEVLAMASAPSFDPLTINNEVTWGSMTDQAENAPERSPLVNRALGTLVTGGPSFYFRPGSTFKVFTAAVAIESGMTNEHFTCRGEGFTPPGFARAVRDFGGEVHGSIGFKDAFRVSCNQYFAQLGLKLGRERMAAYARRLGISSNPESEAGRANDLWQTKNAEPKSFAFIFAPPRGRMDLTSKANSFDLALQSFGQGYDDVTVMQMALLAAAAASPDGTLIAPSLQPDLPKKIIGPFVSAHSAAELRSLMKLVVESGTAAGAFSHLRGRISIAGKTGSADRDVMITNADGDPVVDFMDAQGRPHYKYANWTDSWFIGFAPADDPKIAFAVCVENGGQGAKTAAPIAAKICEKAAALGYFNGAQRSNP